MRLLTLAAAVLLSACTLTQLTPQAKFQDATYTLNDAARWNNVDVAARFVAPDYLARFVARRRLWGSTINIGEYDLARMSLAPDKKSAVSDVTLTWYDQSGVHVHSSSISQRWERVGGTFLLFDEAVRSGDPAVFSPDPEPGTGEDDQGL
jgi:hypothetical protein